MARFWKEPYSQERAVELGIHDFENVLVTGIGRPRWIFYVHVCDFTFAFFSLGMIRQYLDYYSRKILLSSQLSGEFSSGPAASIGDGQSVFERLPLRLRKESKRPIVINALKRAMNEFASDGD